MVSISSPGISPKSLRDFARWLPDVPSRSTCLNESDFDRLTVGRIANITLSSLHFGGVSGSRLSKVKEIIIYNAGSDCLHSIAIRYTSETGGDQLQVLGRASPIKFSRYDSHTEHFPIDGTHGELINSISLIRRRPELAASGLKVNRHISSR
jgi:hypothetical protein